MIKPCEDRIDILEAQLAEANKRIRMLETANGTYATIERELVEAKKDAERYRWLRKRGISLTGSTRGWRSGEYLDKHIDAAIDQAMREGE